MRAIWLIFQGKLWLDSLGYQSLLTFSIETKFIVITKEYKELLWVNKFLHEFDFVQEKYLLFIYENNIYYFYIVKVLFILVRNQLFIEDLNILMWGIIRYKMFFTLSYWK